MKMTKDLLRRYSIGQCTPEENKAVENWLAASNDDIPYFPEGELAEAKFRTWNKLSFVLPEKELPVVPLYKKIIPYAAAACLLFIFSSAAYFITGQSGLGDSQMAINTGSNTTKHVLASGMELTLFSESDARVKSNFYETEAAIEICGKMEMNIMNESKETEISSVCEGKKVSRKVFLEKGNKYFVFTEHNKVMLVDYKALRQMSPYEKKHIMHHIMKLKVS